MADATTVVPAKAARRRVIVSWFDVDGKRHREWRTVIFEYGFGHYVRWNRYTLLVDPMQTELHVDVIAPPPRNKARTVT